MPHHYRHCTIGNGGQGNDAEECRICCWRACTSSSKVRSLQCPKAKLNCIPSVFILEWQAAVVDLAVVIAEVGVAFALIQPWKLAEFSKWYATPRQMCMILALWVQIIMLLFLLLIRLRAMVLSLRGRVLQALLEPYDFLKYTEDSRSHVRIFVLAGFDIWRITFPYASHPFWSKHLLTLHCRHEPRSIIALRGLFGIVFMFSICAYVLWHLVLEPWQETGRIPLVTYTLDRFPQDLQLEPELQWHMIAVRYSPSTLPFPN